MAAARKGSPPYLSYRTFRSFLDSLGAGGVPNRIDRSLMPSKSGTTQALLLSAVRYLRLTSENGVSAPELERLVKAEGAARRNLWRKVLAGAYPALVGPNFDLGKTTTDEVAEVFRNEGVSSPATIRKCVTFFWGAAKDAGIKLSPHVKPYAGTRSATRHTRSRAREVQRPSSRSELVNDPRRGSDPTDLKLLLAKIPDLDPTWPAEYIAKWLMGIEGIRRIAGDGHLEGIRRIAGDGHLAGAISALEEAPNEDRQLKLW